MSRQWEGRPPLEGMDAKWFTKNRSFDFCVPFPADPSYSLVPCVVLRGQTVMTIVQVLRHQGLSNIFLMPVQKKYFDHALDIEKLKRHSGDGYGSMRGRDYRVLSIF